MTRLYPSQPICAVGGFIFRDDAVLLIKRGHPPAKGRWSMPGGVINLGETLEEALLRELYEETTLKVRPVRICKVVDRIERDAKGAIYFHFVIVDYLCEIIEGTPTAASDAADIGFFKVEELDSLEMTKGTAAVIREVFREFQNVG